MVQAETLTNVSLIDGSRLAFSNYGLSPGGATFENIPRHDRDS